MLTLFSPIGSWVNRKWHCDVASGFLHRRPDQSWFQLCLGLRPAGRAAEGGGGGGHPLPSLLIMAEWLLSGIGCYHKKPTSSSIKRYQLQASPQYNNFLKALKAMYRYIDLREVVKYLWFIRELEKKTCPIFWVSLIFTLGVLFFFTLCLCWSRVAFFNQGPFWIFQECLDKMLKD